MSHCKHTKLGDEEARRRRKRVFKQAKYVTQASKYSKANKDSAAAAIEDSHRSHGDTALALYRAASLSQNSFLVSERASEYQRYLSGSCQASFLYSAGCHAFSRTLVSLLSSTSTILALYPIHLYPLFPTPSTPPKNHVLETTTFWEQPTPNLSRIDSAGGTEFRLITFIKPQVSLFDRPHYTRI